MIKQIQKWKTSHNPREYKFTKNPYSLEIQVTERYLIKKRNKNRNAFLVLFNFEIFLRAGNEIEEASSSEAHAAASISLRLSLASRSFVFPGH